VNPVDVIDQDDARSSSKKLVFLGLCDICGYYSQLERGLLKLGVHVTLVNAFPSTPYFRATRPPLLGRVVESIALSRVAAARGSLRRKLLTVAQAFWMAWLFLWSLFTCRAYVFGGGTSFFPPYDLRILKLLGKRVVVVIHGSGSRPPYVDGGEPCGTPSEVAQCIVQTRDMKRRVRAIDDSVDVVVDHVLGSFLHERPFVGFLNVGIPCDISRFEMAPRKAGGGCVIVHAPTNPGPKGTARIEAAIESLRKKGHEITYVKVVGRTNAEVLAAIRECDFVVDELFSDHTMASFATEAAAFGKAAVVGLYGYDLLKKWTEPALLPPAMVCNHDEVEAAIEKLIVDEPFRRSLGESARRFVEEQWDCTRVAERMRSLVDGPIPKSWYVDPRAVVYLHGWGLTDAQARTRVAAIIDAGGVPALQLDHDPVLEAAFVQFARPGSTTTTNAS
jgi:hypothetical protein